MAVRRERERFAILLDQRGEARGAEAVHRGPHTRGPRRGPRPYGLQPYVELLSSRTRPTFDELGAARTLSQMVLDAILQRDRLARLVQFAAHDPANLSVWELLQTTEVTLFPANAATSARDRALQRVAQRAYVDRLIAVAADKE